jgi:nucleotide-binding universal stress UspA family protein
VEVLEQHQGTVADDVHRMLNDYRQHLAQDKHRALEELRQVQLKLPAFFQHTTPLATEGHVVEQIMECVEREAVDLLIVGARSLTAVGRWLSSVTESLMLHCPCSMVICH